MHASPFAKRPRSTRLYRLEILSCADVEPDELLGIFVSGDALPEGSEQRAGGEDGALVCWGFGGKWG